MDGTPDAQLYLKACAGDRDAVRQLIDSHNGDLLGIARAMGLDSHQALDVAQFVWMRFFEHVRAVEEGTKAPLRNPSAVRAWLATSVRNGARDVYRRRKRTGLLVDRAGRETETLTGFVADEDSSDTLIRDELSRAVRRALAKLEDSCRELVALLIADPPLSYETIAEILDRPIGSIGPTRARCLERLRTHLKGEGYE